MIISAATPSKYTSLTLMPVGPRRTGKRISGNPRKEETRGPSIINQISTAREGACKVEAAIAVEAHTHSGLRIVSTMTVKLTIT
jgi:hypothetical protein